MENPALIPFDCGDEEIGLIIKRALQDLRASTDEILNQANKRINECQQRLAGYNRRLALVEQKFEYMKQVSISKNWYKLAFTSSVRRSPVNYVASRISR